MIVLIQIINKINITYCACMSVNVQGRVRVLGLIDMFFFDDNDMYNVNLRYCVNVFFCVCECVCVMAFYLCKTYPVMRCVRRASVVAARPTLVIPLLIQINKRKRC